VIHFWAGHDYERTRRCFPSEDNLVAYSETIGLLEVMIRDWLNPGAVNNLATVQMACAQVMEGAEGAECLGG
jgi:hypothetical protein